MSEREETNVIPLFGNAKAAPSSERADESPYLDLPPGGRIEVGQGCLFISIRSGAGFTIRRNWIRWVDKLSDRLVQKRISFERMCEGSEVRRERFCDCIKIYTASA
jgi:hypothetical protein